MFRRNKQLNILNVYLYYLCTYDRSYYHTRDRINVCDVGEDI